MNTKAKAISYLIITTASVWFTVEITDRIIDFIKPSNYYFLLDYGPYLIISLSTIILPLNKLLNFGGYPFFVSKKSGLRALYFFFSILGVFFILSVTKTHNCFEYSPKVIIPFWFTFIPSIYFLALIFEPNNYSFVQKLRSSLLLIPFISMLSMPYFQGLNVFMDLFNNEEITINVKILNISRNSSLGTRITVIDKDDREHWFCLGPRKVSKLGLEYGTKHYVNNGNALLYGRKSSLGTVIDSVSLLQL